MIEPDKAAFANAMDDLASSDLGYFCMRAFLELHDDKYSDNWHIHAIAHWLTKVEAGDVKRLIITMPPRHLKSFMASVCLPAWLLGRNPAEKIVCASYAHKLSEEFSFETRRLMQTSWYRGVFPGTHLDPKKCSAEVLATTKGGRRRATSVGGSLTGLGGNYVIIDDPIKAGDAHSEVVRESAMQWFSGTVASRLDDPKKGRIIVIAQRLHMDDLPGRLLATRQWQHLNLPMVEWEAMRKIEIAHGRIASRPAGDILHEERMGEEDIARLRADMGERDFEAQYNQRPLPPGGALFKAAWIQRYDEPPARHQVQGIFQSWDTAYSIDEGNDYSVCSTWALSGKLCYLLDIYRARLEFPDLEKAIQAQQKKWKADLVIVEKAGSGISLYQNIRRNGNGRWLQPLTPVGSKQDRASQQTSKFERGEIWLPRQAPWLTPFEEELLAFPHGKFDDQVDSVVQFLAGVDTGRLFNMVEQAKRLHKPR